MNNPKALANRDARGDLLARQRAAFLREGPLSLAERRANLKKLRAVVLADGPDLVADGGFHLFQLGPDKFEGKPLAAALWDGGDTHGAKACEKFHNLHNPATPMSGLSQKNPGKSGVPRVQV